MNREEFMAKTNIKNAAEAKEYLSNFRRSQVIALVVLLVTVVLSFQFLPSNSFMYIIIIALGLAFTFYNDYLYTQLAKAVNYKMVVDKPHYFYWYGAYNGLDPHYRMIIKALKVIADEKSFSETTISEVADDTINGQKPISSTGLLKPFLWAVLIAVLLFVVVGLALKLGLL